MNQIFLGQNFLWPKFLLTFIVQLGSKLNTKLGFNTTTTHPPPTHPPTRNFYATSRHSRRLKFCMMNNQTKPNYSTQLPTKFNPFSTGGEGGGAQYIKWFLNFFGPKILLDPTYFWRQISVGTNMFLCQIFLDMKFLVQKFFLVQTKIFGSKIFFWKEIYSEKRFWSEKKCLVQKQLLVRKHFLVPKNLSGKNLGPKT